MSIRQPSLRSLYRCCLTTLLSLSMLHSANADVSVVSTIRPLQFIAAAIVGDTGTTYSIENSNHSAHNISLTPSDRLQLNQADLLLWIGPDFEIYLADLFTATAEQDSRVKISELADLTLYSMSNQQTDPHLWLDPDNALLIALHIKERLSTEFPEHAEQYGRQFEAFQQQLELAWKGIESRFELVSLGPYVVYHDAYRYFEQALGIRHSSVLVENPEVQPGMRDVLRVRQSIAELNPSCIIMEPDSSTALVDTLISGSNPERVTIDLLGFDIAVTEHAYLDLLNEVATGFHSCVSTI